MGERIQGVRPYLHPWQVTLGVCILLVGLSLISDWQIQNLFWASAHNDVRDRILPVRDALNVEIQRRLTYLDALRAYLEMDLNPENLESRFGSFAAGLTAGNTGIRHFTLAPEGIVRYVYPREGGESYIGRNLTQGQPPKLEVDILRAIQSRRIVLSSPIQAANGEIVLVSRVALYKNTAYWGLAGELTDLEPLMKDAGLSPTPEGLDVALRDGNRRVFWGSAQVFSASAVVLPVDFLEGNWELAVTPVGGWETYSQDKTILSRGLGGLLIGLLTLLTFRISSRQHELDGTVQRRTVEMEQQSQGRQLAEDRLRQSEQRFQKIFQANPAAIAILARSNGTVITANERMESLTGYGEKELVGKSLAEHDLWVDPSDQKRIIQQIEAHSSLASIEARWRTRVAGLRDVIVASTPILLDGEECLLIMVTDNTERRRSELEREQLLQQVQAGRERLRELTRQMVNVQEEERRRISRELHDEAGQALTAVSISLKLVGADLSEEQEELGQRVNDAVDLTHTTLDRIRSLAQKLRPPALDTLGLVPTLEGHCRAFQRRTQIPVNTYLAETGPLPETYNITLYRCLQEALTNVARHAQARHVWVELRCDSGEVCLSVEDDGIGMAASRQRKEADDTQRMGLVGLEERLELLEGCLEIESPENRGTRLVARLPLPVGSKERSG